MVLPLNLEELPPPLRALANGEAPAPASNMAARGVVVGAKPADVVSVLVALARGAAPELASVALGTLRQMPPPLLSGALSGDLQPAVIELLAEELGDRADVVERLLRMPRIAGETLTLLAERADEKIGELVATNEQLLLAHPQAIERLYMNRRVRMSTADRVLELAVRHGLALDIPAYQQAAKAIQNELIPVASDEPSFDDVLYQQTDALARQLELSDEEDTHEPDESGEEVVAQRFLPLHAQIAQLTISQKIRRAILGTAAERMLLVRDTNRLVAAAAASSPQFTEHDAARVTSSRNVHDDVLRLIAQNRNFTRSYQVKLNLVSNPKTPLTFSSRLLPHLRDTDVRLIAKSKNVPANVQSLARQQMMRKEAKRK